MCENDVEGVERSLNSSNCYSCYSCRKGRKWCLWLMYTVQIHSMLCQKGQKIMLCWNNHTIQCYICQRGWKLFRLLTPSTCFNIHSIGWLERSKSQLSKTFFGLKISWILRKLWAKMLWALTAYFGGARGHFVQSTLLTLSTWVWWVTLLCIQCCVKATNTTFNPFNMSDMRNN